MILATLLCTLLAGVDSQSDLSFPPGFKFGVGTSSYQIEGAWNVSDKGESIHDRYTHTFSHLIKDNSNGDVACDSYYQWQRDIEMLLELGVDFYRFSISWPRILPSGFANQISEDGKNYYNNLIDGLLEKGVEPQVTIYHWDLPQSLQDLGGWTNPLIVDWFGDYSRVLFNLYSDRVQTWFTINEPISICDIAYANYSLAPNVYDVDVGRYLCTKNVLMAHAKAWRIYDEEFRARDNGEIGIVNHMVWMEPMVPGDEDLAELAVQHGFGRFAHGIYSAEGGWPPTVEKIIAEKSAAEGYPTSRLPAFTAEEIEFLKGTSDFIAMNHYTSRLVRRPEPGERVGAFPLQGSPDMDLKMVIDPDWWESPGWNKPHPVGFRRCLSWLKKQYGDHKIIISENGYPTTSAALEDNDRVVYYKAYLEQMLLSIKEDGVNVISYTAWSLMDNFEWFDGYSTKYGLYYVNFTDASRPRVPRRSASYYAAVVAARSLDVPSNYTTKT